MQHLVKPFTHYLLEQEYVQRSIVVVSRIEHKHEANLLVWCLHANFRPLFLYCPKLGEC
jgi:hypothetical protein